MIYFLGLNKLLFGMDCLNLEDRATECRPGFNISFIRSGLQVVLISVLQLLIPRIPLWNANIYRSFYRNLSVSK